MARDDRGRGEYRQRFPAGQVLANHTRVGVKREDKGPGEGLEEEAVEVGLERLTEPLHDLRRAERAAVLSRSGGHRGESPRWFRRAQFDLRYATGERETVP